jgi:uncharacterized protein YuzE
MNFMIPRTLKSVLASTVLSGSACASRAGDGALAVTNFFPMLPRYKRMTAGSLPDTGKNRKGFVIRITQPPIVEIDTEANAAYIRLRDTKVVATKPYGSEKGLVMLDFDANENVVGIEVVGQQEFSIRELIKQIPLKTSDAVLNQTRYVAADLQPA